MKDEGKTVLKIRDDLEGMSKGEEACWGEGQNLEASDHALAARSANQRSRVVIYRYTL
jgi:hypothetical protein